MFWSKVLWNKSLNIICDCFFAVKAIFLLNFSSFSFYNSIKTCCLFNFFVIELACLQRFIHVVTKIKSLGHNTLCTQMILLLLVGIITFKLFPQILIMTRFSFKTFFPIITSSCIKELLHIKTPAFYILSLVLVHPNLFSQTFQLNMYNFSH